jgi:hypothetical protein
MQTGRRFPDSPATERTTCLLRQLFDFVGQVRHLHVTIHDFAIFPDEHHVVADDTVLNLQTPICGEQVSTRQSGGLSGFCAHVSRGIQADSDDLKPTAQFLLESIEFRGVGLQAAVETTPVVGC